MSSASSTVLLPHPLTPVSTVSADNPSKLPSRIPRRPRMVTDSIIAARRWSLYREVPVQRGAAPEMITIFGDLACIASRSLEMRLAYFDIDFQILFDSLPSSSTPPLGPAGFPLPAGPSPGAHHVARPPFPRSYPRLPHRAVHPLWRAAREHRAGHAAARARGGAAATNGARRCARAPRGADPCAVAQPMSAQLAVARPATGDRAPSFALTRVVARGYTNPRRRFLGLVPGT